jgi:WD40 repeat protein
VRAIAPDGKACVGVDEKGIASIAGKEVSKALLGSPLSSLALSRDGHRLVLGATDGSIGLFDTNDPGEHPTLLSRGSSAKDSRITALAISADGRRVAAGGEERTVRVWDLDNPAAGPATLPETHAGPVNIVAFSHDGRRLFTSSLQEFGLNQWKLDDFTCESALAINLMRPRITALAISPDGRWIVAGMEDGTVHVSEGDSSLFGLDKARVLRQKHAGRVVAVAISPDSRWFVSLGEDKAIRHWDFSDLQLDPVVLESQVQATALAISPDCRYLYAGDADGKIRRYPMQLDELIERAGEVAGRNLSLTEWRDYFPGQKYVPTFLDQPFPPHRATSFRVNADPDPEGGVPGVPNYAPYPENLTRDEWQRVFPGETYRKIFPYERGPDPEDR